MKITTDFKVNLKTKEIQNKVKNASERGLKDIIVDIANSVIKEHPWKTQTGTNSRSIKYEVGPGKPVATDELEGAVYSTSGYGGYLETGTATMPAFPYFRPALDKHSKKLPKNIKAHL